MDWGLLQGNGLLKDELVYSQQLYYYAAMLADVLLRVSWAINILLAQMKDSSAAATASALLAPLEVLRRCIWNLFRLENEQLKNCEKCCAVRDFWNIWRHLEKDQNGKGDKTACWGNRCRDSSMYLRKKIYPYANEQDSKFISECLDLVETFHMYCIFCIQVKLS
ncbi:xenotropic and polytropic retrovirus receptor 1 homolog isoform X2 [Pimephales promelas]|uniref:xenotropic and polytropic retrovirus receptor 1 homolog isoform X2 n=1 Tax=Pimephales promelas TaxID=90988 RepID=UPI001955D16B|nr:xenotropic and polytropic retrovirus receptor 1 homolog isoform X2 [Pimephales promelas]